MTTFHRTPGFVFSLFLSLGLHILLMFALTVVRLTEPPESEGDSALSVALVSEEAMRPRPKRAWEPVRPRSKSPLPSRLVAETSPKPMEPRTFAPREITLADDQPLLAPSILKTEAVAPAGLVGEPLGERPLSSELGGREQGGRETHARFPPAWRGERSGLKMAMEIGGAARAGGFIKDVPPPSLRSPLEVIADSLATRPRTTNRVDVVFLLDVSQSMQDNIYAVSRHLEKMAERLSVSGLDYRVGIVTFHHTMLTSVLGGDLKATPLTDDIARVRKTLRNVKCRGNEKALDALVDAISLVNFREGASRHFVFVTDEYVDGTYDSRQVFGSLYRAGIQVDVIGKDEPFQRALAARTGGIWMSIADLPG